MKFIAKKSGASGVVDMIPVIITVTLCGIIIIYFAGQIKYLDVCNSINNMARRFILKMESSRGMTQEDMSHLVSELESYGVTDISLEGTTMYNPSLRPGDDIVFCINCKYDVQGLSTDGLLSLSVPGVERHINVERYSVVLR